MSDEETICPLIGQPCIGTKCEFCRSYYTHHFNIYDDEIKTVPEEVTDINMVSGHLWWKKESVEKKILSRGYTELITVGYATITDYECGQSHKVLFSKTEVRPTRPKVVIVYGEHEQWFRYDGIYGFVFGQPMTVSKLAPEYQKLFPKDQNP